MVSSREYLEMHSIFATRCCSDGHYNQSPESVEVAIFILLT